MLILILTGLPGSCIPKVKPQIGLDKIVHCIMYAGFTFISLWGYREPFREKGKAYLRKASWMILAIGIVFGALTEIMQETLVPGRIGNVYDWIADILGSIIGVVIFYFFFQKRNKLKNEAYCK